MKRLKLNIQRFADTDGWVTIGFKGDTSQLEKDIKAEERRLKQFEKESEKLATAKLKVEVDLQEYERLKKVIEDTTKTNLKIYSTEKGKQRAIEEQKIAMENLNQAYSKQLNNLSEVKRKIKENAHQQELTKTKISEMNSELTKAKGFGDIKNSIDNIGESVKNVTKKVIKWGLAIFSIRSAYMLVRQSMSSLSQYDDQLKTDVEYIRYAIANALKPVIEVIVKLVYKLLVYIAYIAKAWFNVNIFANATAKGFQNADKSAKKLQKTLAGFDEMNVLNENGTVGVGGITAPSIDLSDWENVEIPGWVEWIANNKRLILDFLKEVAIFFATVKIASFLYSFLELSKVLDAMSGLALFGMLAGIAITVMGIYQTISGLIDFIADPCWETFTEVLAGLSTILIGVGIALIAFNASNPVGWIITAIGVVGNLTFSVGGLVDQLLGEESQAERTKKAEDNLKKSREEVAEATDAYVNAVDKAEEAERKLKEAEEKHNISGKELYNLVKKGKLDYKDMNTEQREVYKAYLNNQEAQKKLKSSTKELTSANKTEANSLIGVQYELGRTTGDYSKFKQAIYDAMAQGKISAKDAETWISFAMVNMSNSAKKTFTQDIPSDVSQAFKTSQYQGEWNKFESWWNNNISKLNKKATLSYTITASSSSSKKRAKGGMFYPSLLPKLASGGIINRPGAGVPYNGAIIGERGAEAVLPLTDSQQMQLLGQTIGRYITVNLTNVTELDGRTIARKVSEVNTNTDFLLNR